MKRLLGIHIKMPVTRSAKIFSLMSQDIFSYDNYFLSTKVNSSIQYNPYIYEQTKLYSANMLRKRNFEQPILNFGLNIQTSLTYLMKNFIHHALLTSKRSRAVLFKLKKQNKYHYNDLVKINLNRIMMGYTSIIDFNSKTNIHKAIKYMIAYKFCKK